MNSMGLRGEDQDPPGLDAMCTLEDILSNQISARINALYARVPPHWLRRAAKIPPSRHFKPSERAYHSQLSPQELATGFLPRNIQ